MATTTVDSSPHAHTPIAFVGNAQLDTAYQAVGTASLLLDGSTTPNRDYLTVGGTEADFDICASATDSWTVDFHVRHADHAGNEYYVRHGGTGASTLRWYIYHNDDNSGTDGLTFAAGTGTSTTISLSSAGEISDTDWHWIVLAKVGSVYALYKDGTQVNYTLDTSTVNAAGVLYVGGTDSSTNADPLNGSMDEVRIFHANVFNAAPNSGRTDVITNIPEPATIALLGIGSLALLRKRRACNEPGLKAASQSVAFDALHFRA
jgi:hypothetical protein